MTLPTESAKRSTAFGDFHFDSLREFLASGPYTARQAVLSHLGYLKRHPHVYGGPSPRQMYEQHWR